MDAAGIIDEVGERSGFVMGNRGMTMAQTSGQHGGGYAQILIADADPRMTQLCTGLHIADEYLTALLALDELVLKPGDVLAVTSSAGAFGRYAIALAKHAGLTKVAGYAEKDLELVKATGAGHLVHRGDDIAAKIRG